MAFGNGPRIVTEGLVLAVDAADRNSYAGSGNSWNSLGTGDYTGTLTNGPTFSAADGGSIVFDGTNDFVNSIVYPVTSPFSFYTGSFTLEAIVKPTSYQTASYFGLVNMIMIKGNSATTINYATQVTSDTSVSFIKRGSTEDLQYHAFTVPSMRNRISSITFTINAAGTTVTCYFNGNLIGSTAITGTKIEPSSNDNLRFSGISTTGLGTQFIGNIYSVKIYNIPLSAAQVAQNVAAVKSRYTLQTPTNITSDQAISIAIFNDTIELYPQLTGYTSYADANAFALVLSP
jgi:hypothetical protein